MIAEGLRVEQTIISKIMTRNPLYVTADTLAIEALQKMVQGMCDLPLGSCIPLVICLFSLDNLRKYFELQRICYSYTLSTVKTSQCKREIRKV